MDCIALFLFIVGSTCLTGAGQQQALGGLLIISSLNLYRKNGVRSSFFMSQEMKMLLAWVLWAAITGPLVATEMELLWFGGLRQGVQVSVLALSVYSISFFRGELALKAVMFGLLVGGIIQILSIVCGGGVLVVSGVSERALGLTRNANGLGIRMIWAFWAVAMLWPYHRHGKGVALVKICLALFIPLLAVVLLMTGSRKSLFVFIFVVSAWLWYPLAPRDMLQATLWKIALIACILIFGGSVGDYISQNTLAGQRMVDHVENANSVEEMEETRVGLYKEGIEMVGKSPVWGVGINQFRALSLSGMYSHSNYMEPLATTGIVGFILYQGIFFLPLWRARKLSKRIRWEEVVYQLKVIQIACVAVLLLGFGSPFYTSTTVIPVLAVFSAYTFKIKRDSNTDFLTEK